MTPGLALFLLFLIGLVLSTLGATAAQVLHDFSRHELEEYCRVHQRTHWFDRIMANREQLALGAESLQMLSIALSTLCGLAWILGERPFASLSAANFVSLIALCTIVLLVCNSWIPWGVARLGAAPFLFHTWRLWWLVSTIVSPLTFGFKIVTAFLRRVAGVRDEEEDEEEALEDEIRSIVSEGEREGLLEADVRDMIEGVIELDDTDVGKVMTPRSKVNSLDVNTPWKEMCQFVVDVGRTRIPVFDQKLDEIVGILYSKDVLAEVIKPQSERRQIRDLVRRPIMVPESTLLDEMLQQFLQQHVHMAIVRDEYGAVAGVVTIEDVLEEIVGEIVDEADDDEPLEIRRINGSQFEVVGTVHVERLNEELGLRLPEDEDFDTLSGLIAQQLNEIPEPGRQWIFDNVRFEVQQASARVVEKVLVTVLGDPQRNGNHQESP